MLIPRSHFGCVFFNFSDSFFDIQLNLEKENIFESQAKENQTGQPSSDSAKTLSSVDWNFSVWISTVLEGKKT